jgi:hypothetical protein
LPHRMRGVQKRVCRASCVAWLLRACANDYRGASLIRTLRPVGPYSSPVPWDPWVILWGWVFLMSKVPP